MPSAAKAADEWVVAGNGHHPACLFEFQPQPHPFKSLELSIMSSCKLPLRAVALSLALSATALTAQASDRAGEYSVRGGGAQRCETYLASVNENRPDLGAYIGYIDGALTTASRLTAGTFDVSPFILPGPFAAIVANICRQAPTQLFELAVRAGVEALARARVAASSPIVEMTVGENRMSLRAETLTAVQTRLRALNLIRDNPDGRFGAATQEGLRRFQTANQLTVTGLPDPDTILALLVRTR